MSGQTQTPPQDDQQTKTPAQQWSRSPKIAPGTPAFKYLTEQEGIAPGIIEAATNSDGVREGPNSTAWFAQRSANGEITGVSGNGPDFNVMLRGSHKTLFRLPGSEVTSRIVVTEQPLEAMAVAQIEKLRPDTLYVATGGAMSMASAEALTAEIARVREQPNPELSIAVGRSGNAEQAAKFASKIGEEAKIKTVRNAPPGNSFTWHQHLRENPTPDSLAPAQPASGAKAPAGVIATGAQGGTIDPAQDKVSKADAQGGPSAEPPKPPKPDPIADLLEQLKKAAASGDSSEIEKLREKINELLAGGTEPGVYAQASYRKDVAWVLMDVEKLTGARVQIDQTLRDELATRATIDEKISNPSVARLLAATRNIFDQKLVEDIRNLADFTAAQAYPQMSPEITRPAAQLEERVLNGLTVATTIGSTAQQKASVDQAETLAAGQESRSAADKNQAATDKSQAARQEVTGANQVVNQNNSENKGTRQEQATTPATVASNQVVAPVRQSGDFLKVLNGIALAWHEKIYGPGSFTSQREAEKHAEAVAAAKARGEAPPPAPVMPPPPTFTYDGMTPAKAAPTPPDPQANPATPNAAQPAPAKATRTEETVTTASVPGARTSPIVEYAKEIVLGSGKPDESKIARADAPANWPKHADSTIDAVGGSIIGDRFGKRVEAATNRAANAAVEAKAAVEDLMTGPGRDITSRITHAAKAEGGNVDAVLAEMKPNGKYASLREEFQSQILRNPALAEATERAVNKVNAYGEARDALDTAMRRIERNPEEVEGQFRATDEMLAKATSVFPGSAPGTALIENLGQKIREALRHVVDVIRHALGLESNQTQVQQPRQDNSPGMGM